MLSSMQLDVGGSAQQIRHQSRVGVNQLRLSSVDHTHFTIITIITIIIVVVVVVVVVVVIVVVVVAVVVVVVVVVVVSSEGAGQPCVAATAAGAGAGAAGGTRWRQWSCWLLSVQIDGRQVNRRTADYIHQRTEHNIQPSSTSCRSSSCNASNRPHLLTLQEEDGANRHRQTTPTAIG